MDHTECRKRIDQLEDDLDYNIGRKEDLKAEVRKLEKRNEDLHETNWTDAKAFMETKVKMADLKKMLENVKKENADLSNDNTYLRDIEAENRKLKEMIQSTREEKDKEIDNIKEKNQELQKQIENLLKCDECGLHLDAKASIKEHILSKHSKLMFTCVQCDDCFQDKGMLKAHVLANHVVEDINCSRCEKNLKVKQSLKEHLIKEHSSKSQRNDLQKKINELTNRVTGQRIKLHGDLFNLKQKELMKKGSCKCQGKFCKINHMRFRWTMSRADCFFSRLLLISPEYITKEATGTKFYQCNKCEKMCDNIEGMKTHNITNHSQHDLGEAQESILGSFSYECEMCDEMLDDTDNLQKHIETIHTQHFKCKLCDNEFSNDTSLGKHIESEHISTYKCQQCEMIFIREKTLETHIGTNHSENLLNSTFFNPSAVN